MEYIITKAFISGALKGIQIEEKTTVKYCVGDKVKSFSGSDYRVLKVVEV